MVVKLPGAQAQSVSLDSSGTVHFNFQSYWRGKRVFYGASATLILATQVNSFRNSLLLLSAGWSIRQWKYALAFKQEGATSSSGSGTWFSSR